MGSARKGAVVKKPAVVNLNVLPGEPTDGSGRVCIHLFVRDDSGPFVETHVLHPKLDEDGNPVSGKGGAGPARGRLACDPKRLVAVTVRGNVSVITPRSDDPRAVTCPKCRASVDYREAMKRLGA